MNKERLTFIEKVKIGIEQSNRREVIDDDELDCVLPDYLVEDGNHQSWIDY